MNEEQKLEIQVNGQYKNINLRDLENGNYIIVEKVFKDTTEKTSPGKYGKPFTFYPASIIYQGEQVGMIINGEEYAQAYNECGDQGDKVKITLTKEIYTNPKTKKEGVKNVLSFKKV